MDTQTSDGGIGNSEVDLDEVGRLVDVSLNLFYRKAILDGVWITTAVMMFVWVAFAGDSSTRIQGMLALWAVTVVTGVTCDWLSAKIRETTTAARLAMGERR